MVVRLPAQSNRYSGYQTTNGNLTMPFSECVMLCLHTICKACLLVSFLSLATLKVYTAPLTCFL